MKQAEDTKTAELPGLTRRGRRPTGEQAMTNAERQKAYRRRKHNELFDPVTDMSRVTLMQTLAQALARIEEEDYEFREGAQAVAEQAISELVTRYALKIKRVTKA